MAQLVIQIVIAVNGNKVRVVFAGCSGYTVRPQAGRRNEASDLTTDGACANHQNLLALGSFCIPVLPLVFHLQTD